MADEKGCCAPARAVAGTGDRGVAQQAGPAEVRASAIRIPGGATYVGTDKPLIARDEEGPARKLKLPDFAIAPTAVTNAEFARFIAATGYQTDAERFGWSFVFWSDAPDKARGTLGAAGTEWWRRIDGADWRNITGGGGDAAADLPDHPVVHVSWNDARAYAAWAGGRLPSEAEWEHAARGGDPEAVFPWGARAPNDRNFFPCNIWQGDFPYTNTLGDGFQTTAPAQSYAPNGYGLYNMVGNVWEWTSEPFRLRSLKRESKQRAAQMRGYKLIKGGSFLCHKSYCFRYRIAARTGTTPDTTTTHQGFRVVWDVT